MFELHFILLSFLSFVIMEVEAYLPWNGCAYQIFTRGKDGYDWVARQLVKPVQLVCLNRH